jgi:septum formation inhibitor-activating ATPase MinD
LTTDQKTNAWKTYFVLAASQTRDAMKASAKLSTNCQNAGIICDSPAEHRNWRALGVYFADETIVITQPGFLGT